MTSLPARPDRPTPTLTARSPEDLLAVARVVLGFEPGESVVLLTAGQPSFHARVDLPSSPGDLELVVESLVEPAVRHRVDAAVLLLYTPDRARARRVARLLRRGLEGHGVRVLEALRADEGRWYPLFRDRDGLGASGVPYDVSTHPFLVAAVLEGRVIHGSRAELARTLDPDPDQVAATTACLPCEPVGPDWVSACVDRHALAGSSPGPAESARLLAALADPRLRDVAWGGFTRDEARDQVRLWSGLVRAAPTELVPNAAAVLALAAWLAGDGALAWCALDRALEVDPDHTLAELVAGLLLRAVPPGEWDRLVAGRPAAS